MSRENNRRTKAAANKAATSHSEVDEVVNRLIEVIGYCDCSPAPQLGAEMTANYLPGFTTVLSQAPPAVNPTTNFLTAAQVESAYGSTYLPPAIPGNLVVEGTSTINVAPTANADDMLRKRATT